MVRYLFRGIYSAESVDVEKNLTVTLIISHYWTESVIRLKEKMSLKAIIYLLMIS